MSTNPTPNNESNILETAEKTLPPSIGGWFGFANSINNFIKFFSIKIQLGFALIGLMVAVYYIYQWRQISHPLGERIEASFREKLDNTVWQHKGLAAYLLSELDNPVQTQPNITGIALSEIQAKINSIPIIDTSDEKVFKENENVRSLLNFELYGDYDGPRFKKAIFRGDDSYFMSLPATALSLPANNDLNKTSNLPEIIFRNPEIVQDINLAENLKETLRNFNNGSVNDQQVVQTYFITESGLILLSSNFVSNQRLFYLEQFETYHNFTDRSYFWEAVKKFSEESSRANEFDYQTEPYIDLGGHGIIKTYSKAFKLPGGRFGVIGVDVKRENLKDELQKRLEIFRTNEEPYEYVPIKVGDIVPLDQKIPEDFRWFFNELNQNIKLQSKMLGKIATEPKSADGIMRFTIPLNSTFGKTGRDAEIMCVRINFKEFWARQSRYLAYGSIGAMIFFLVIFNIFQDYNLLWRKIDEMVTKFDRVMTKAETPYVRLNDKNEFEFVNDSFVKMLHYRNETPLTDDKSKETFSSLVAQQSIHDYKKRLKESLNEKNPLAEEEPYEIYLYDKNGKLIKATVHGERIVFPSIRKKKYPSRIGVFIKWEQVNEKIFDESQPTNQSDSSSQKKDSAET